MNDLSAISAFGDIARYALRFALIKMSNGGSNLIPDSENVSGVDFSKRWITALHDGFGDFYRCNKQIVVLSRAYPSSGATEKWGRSEYLYDLSVVEAEQRPAPIHASAFVPVVTRALWQVESEIAPDSVKVAEDLGKLVLGSAASKLLISAYPSAEQNYRQWMEFFEKAAQHVPNNFFLAMMPSYSTLGSAHQAWTQKSAQILFHQRIDGKLKPDAHPISID